MSEEKFFIEKSPFARILTELMREESIASNLDVCSNTNYLTGKIEELVKRGLVEFHFPKKGRKAKYYNLTGGVHRLHGAVHRGPVCRRQNRFIRGYGGRTQQQTVRLFREKEEN